MKHKFSVSIHVSIIPILEALLMLILFIKCLRGHILQELKTNGYSDVIPELSHCLWKIFCSISWLLSPCTRQAIMRPLLSNSYSAWNTMDMVLCPCHIRACMFQMTLLAKESLNLHNLPSPSHHLIVLLREIIRARIGIRFWVLVTMLSYWESSHSQSLSRICQTHEPLEP